MLCNNCGKREANVKYTETINGETRRINLCEECSKKLGLIPQKGYDRGHWRKIKNEKN